MTQDLNKAGDAFIRLGRALKTGNATGLDDKTLVTLLELVKCVPNRNMYRMGPPKWSEEKDPIGSTILHRIRTGQAIPAGTSGKEATNALLRLRRNGIIINRGSRTKPNWCLTTDDERKQVVDDIRTHRIALRRKK